MAPAREGGQGTRVWVDSLAGLLGLVEMGEVELHAWNATVDDIVIETALVLRRMLRDEGLEPWPKLTGARACT